MGENEVRDPFAQGVSEEYLQDIAKYFEVDDIDGVWDTFLVDASYVSRSDPSIEDIDDLLDSAPKSLIATLFYRLSHKVYSTSKSKARRISEYGSLLTGIEIHPGAEIVAPLFIDHGYKIVIGQDVKIGPRCRIFQGCVLGATTKEKDTERRHPTIGADVTLCPGCKILGGITIGDNSFISPDCVVLDDIPAGTKVSNVCQLQFQASVVRNTLPRQKLIIYGAIPKWKNTLVIEGSGIYNPTILVKCRTKLTYHIDYWDKNKIILKFEPKEVSHEDLHRTKIVILSRSDKVILAHCYALYEVLK